MNQYLISALFIIMSDQNEIFVNLFLTLADNLAISLFIHSKAGFLNHVVNIISF